jgi:hypothetical protein
MQVQLYIRDSTSRLGRLSCSGEPRLTLHKHFPFREHVSRWVWCRGWPFQQCQRVTSHRQRSMARGKRRTTRSSARKPPERTPELEPLSPLSTRSSLTPVPVQDPEPESTSVPEQEQEPAEEPEPIQETPVESVPTTEEDTCPACKALPASQFSAGSKENWIRCDACKTWYHWICAGDGGDVDAIDKWQVYTTVISLEYLS